MPSRWINTAEQIPIPNAKVISVGDLPELLLLRKAVLESSGFQVFSTHEAVHAMLRIENGDCGVLLLCYSLDDQVRQELSNRFRERCPNGRIVVITNQPLPHPPLEADAVVYGVKGPEALIAAVRGETATR